MHPILLLIPAALQSQQPADHRGQPYVIERMSAHNRFESDGTSLQRLAVRVRIQNDAGVQAFGQLELAYDSSTHRIAIDTVRVIKPSGDTITTPASAIQDVTSPVTREAPIYSDVRSKVVTVQALRPGDVLEYHATWHPRRPVVPGHFWLGETLPTDAILLDYTLTVDVPRDRALRISRKRIAEPAVSERGDRRVYQWRFSNTAIDTAAMTREMRGLPVEEHAIELSTFSTWADVGRWYAELERPQETPTPAIRAKADSLVRGRSTLHDSVAALYHFVSGNFRYVSLSFGQGRYRPHTAAEVLAVQYGDCKDKHVLLASLLRAIGLESAPVLISSAMPVDSAVPSPGQFDHLITMVVVRGDTVWLDATPEVAPYQLLLRNLRGKQALLMPLNAPARLVWTPAAPPFPMYEQYTGTARIAADGRLTMQVVQHFRGDGEVVMRTVLRQVPPERLPLLGTQVARMQSLSGDVTNVRTSDPANAVQPLEVTYELNDANAVKWAGTRGTLSPPLPALLAVEIDSLSRDSVPVGQGEMRARLVLELPEGVTATPPAPVTLSRPYAEYRSTYRVEGGRLIAERFMQFRGRFVSGSLRSDLRALFSAIRNEQQQAVVLTRSRESAAAPPPAGRDVAQQYQDALRAYHDRQYPTALRLMRRVVTAEPQHADAWNDLGLIYLDMGQGDSARAALRRQLTIDPRHRYAWNNLGRAHWRLSRHDSAEAAFRRQIDLSPMDQYAHGNLGALLLEMDRDSAALVALRQAVSVTPNQGGVLYDLARAYLGIGQPDSALTAFRRALAIQATASNYNNAAYALAEAGAHLDEAERWSRQSLDSVAADLADLTIETTGPEEYRSVFALANYWDTMGWILFRRNDFAGAERYLRASWTLLPRVEAGEHLMAVLERLNRRPETVRIRGILPELRPRSAGPAPSRTTTQAARRQLLDMRTMRAGRSSRAIYGEVTLMLGPGNVVHEIQGSDEIRAIIRPLTGGTTALFPFPDDSPIRLPRRAFVSCSGAGPCSIIFHETTSWTNQTTPE